MDKVLTTIKAARTEIWKLIDQGKWPSVDHARAAIKVHEHLDKALKLLEDPLSQMPLPEPSTDTIQVPPGKAYLAYCPRGHMMEEDPEAVLRGVYFVCPGCDNKAYSKGDTGVSMAVEE